jgi:hypothetical protein
VLAECAPTALVVALSLCSTTDTHTHSLERVFVVVVGVVVVLLHTCDERAFEKGGAPLSLGNRQHTWLLETPAKSAVPSVGR